MKRLLKRITENTEIFSRTNLLKHHQYFQLPPFSSDPSHPFHSSERGGSALPRRSLFPFS